MSALRKVNYKLSENTGFTPDLTDAERKEQDYLRYQRKEDYRKIIRSWT